MEGLPVPRSRVSQHSDRGLSRNYRQRYRSLADSIDAERRCVMMPIEAKAEGAWKGRGGVWSVEGNEEPNLLQCGAVRASDNQTALTLSTAVRRRLR